MVLIEEIKRRLWDGANELRGSMDASRYKDYMLGLMFYKFLSDKMLYMYGSVSKQSTLMQKELFEAYKNEKTLQTEVGIKTFKRTIGFYIAPEHLYHSWLEDIDRGKFEIEKVIDSLNEFEHQFANDENNDFSGLFANANMDLSNTALGSSLNDRNNNIKALILLFADLDMIALQKNDVLGDAYEYLIGQFAMESGKKAGEFYTPRAVSEILAQTVAASADIKSIYDPCVGSASLLLTVRKYLDNNRQRELEYYGQEKNTATYNLTRMNLLLHGVKTDKITVRNADTLAEDWPEDPKNPDRAVQFDAVVMNPPYSLSKWNKAGLKVSDPRFENYGCLPPDSKGDYAFLLHGLYHLERNGAMSIVLPHGVLFRGGTEGEIRKKLIEKNQIDTIIGLPNNLFTNTGIPVVVIVLKKNRKNDDLVLFIDASNGYAKVGKQNVLREKDIAKIIHTFRDKKREEGYSFLATREDIIKNDYNLNIPRYVQGGELEIPHDVDAHLFGGIPKKNINSLKTINALCKSVLERNICDLREGYVELKQDIHIVENEILSADQVLSVMDSIKEKSSVFAEVYMNKLRNIKHLDEISTIKNEMFAEILALLLEYEFIDEYDGYQIVADIWNNSLTHDTEMIANLGFYTAGRMREPHMVIKGSGKKKREEQDGWNGVIVSKDIIRKLLYKDRIIRIENSKKKLQIIEDDLLQLAELAIEEDTVENTFLFDVLKKNEEEVQAVFDNKLVKSELKKCDKKSDAYILLEKVDTLILEKTTLAKKIKEDEAELIKEIEDRIEKLTDSEVDELMFEKWFGTFVTDMETLSVSVLKNEIETLKMLNDRYAATLNDIEDEISKAMDAFSILQKELVVM